MKPRRKCTRAKTGCAVEGVRNDESTCCSTALPLFHCCCACQTAPLMAPPSESPSVETGSSSKTFPDNQKPPKSPKDLNMDKKQTLHRHIYPRKCGVPTCNDPKCFITSTEPSLVTFGFHSQSSETIQPSLDRYAAFADTKCLS